MPLRLFRAILVVFILLVVASGSAQAVTIKLYETLQAASKSSDLEAARNRRLMLDLIHQASIEAVAFMSVEATRKGYPAVFCMPAHMGYSPSLAETMITGGIARLKNAGGIVDESMPVATILVGELRDAFPCTGNQPR